MPKLSLITLVCTSFTLLTGVSTHAAGHHKVDPKFYEILFPIGFTWYSDQFNDASLKNSLNSSVNPLKIKTNGVKPMQLTDVIGFAPNSNDMAHQQTAQVTVGISGVNSSSAGLTIKSASPGQCAVSQSAIWSMLYNGANPLGVDGFTYSDFGPYGSVQDNLYGSFQDNPYGSVQDYPYGSPFDPSFPSDVQQSWNTHWNDNGSYAAGSSTPDPAPTPEPGTAAAFTVGICLLAVLLFKKQTHKKVGNLE